MHLWAIERHLVIFTELENGRPWDSGESNNMDRKLAVWMEVW